MGDDVEEEPVGEDTQDEARGLKKPFSPLLPRRTTKTEANLDWQSKARLTIRDSQLLLAALSGKVSRRVCRVSRTAFVPARYHAAIAVIRRRQSEGNCGGTKNTDGKPLH